MGMLSKMLREQFDRTGGGMPVRTITLPSGLSFRARVNAAGLKEIVCWRDKGFDERTPALERELSTMAREAGMEEHSLERVASKPVCWLVAEVPFKQAVAVQIHPGDGLPEHLHGMVNEAHAEGDENTVGTLERRAYIVSGAWGSGMVNEPNEYVREWYAVWLKARSEHALERLQSMYAALCPQVLDQARTEERRAWAQLGVD